MNITQNFFPQNHQVSISNSNSCSHSHLFVENENNPPKDLNSCKGITEQTKGMNPLAMLFVPNANEKESMKVFVRFDEVREWYL
jgi:hypothetical protein